MQIDDDDDEDDSSVSSAAQSVTQGQAPVAPVKMSALASGSSNLDADGDADTDSPAASDIVPDTFKIPTESLNGNGPSLNGHSHSHQSAAGPSSHKSTPKYDSVSVHRQVCSQKFIAC